MFNENLYENKLILPPIYDSIWKIYVNCMISLFDLTKFFLAWCLNNRSYYQCTELQHTVVDYTVFM